MHILHWWHVQTGTSSACQHGILFSTAFLYIVDFKGKFFHVVKTLVADITIIIIRKVCCFRKMEKIYMLILVSMDLQISSYHLVSVLLLDIFVTFFTLLFSTLFAG